MQPERVPTTLSLGWGAVLGLVDPWPGQPQAPDRLSRDGLDTGFLPHEGSQFIANLHPIYYGWARTLAP